MMKVPASTLIAPVALALMSQPAFADDVRLPAPILEWSFYVLLIFGACVAIGVFFLFQRKDRKSEPLTSVIGDREAAVHSAASTATVEECVRQMNANKIGAMLIIDDGALKGIFTERDAITKVLGGARDAATTPVSEVMTPDPVCVTPETPVNEAMAIVTNNRFRHLPVVSDGKVVGMISSGDLTHWLVQDLSGEIKDLVSVAGRRESA